MVETEQNTTDDLKCEKCGVSTTYADAQILDARGSYDGHVHHWVETGEPEHVCDWSDSDCRHKVCEGHAR